MQSGSAESWILSGLEDSDGEEAEGLLSDQIGN
jgi:hypothetical protein